MNSKAEIFPSINRVSIDQENPYVLERILQRINVEDRGWETPCWISDRSCDRYGYTRITAERRTWKTHRYALHLLGVLMPAPLVVDHLCRQHACTRPSHLDQVYNVVNVNRGIGFGAVNAFKTHCPQGHKYTRENTYMFRGKPNHRSCLKCRRLLDVKRSQARSKLLKEKRNGHQ